MSNGYGIDIYGLSTYGYSQPADYSVAPFIASQTGYGEITLTWASPNVTSWKLLNLVRSVYGFPTTAVDGVLIQEITPGSIIRTYDDPNLTPGIIYYYTMFIAVEAPAWNIATNYSLNAQVLYNGLYWSATQSNSGRTPAAGSVYWTPTTYIPTWLPAGYAATLALGNQGYGQMLYDRSPQPYKITTSDTFSNTAIDNPELLHYLSLFGFGLDTLKASYDSYLNSNNPDKVSATNLDILGQQLGIQTDYLSTPQQRRQRIKNASVNYRMKGQTQGIHNLIADITGWDSEITYGQNIYNSADQTAFVSPVLNQWNQFATYFNPVSGSPDTVQYNGYDYRANIQSSGLGQAPSGTSSTNTWWTAISSGLNSVALKNPATNQFSTWSVAGVAGTTAVISGVTSGLPHPTDTAINNWHALSISQSNNPGTGIYNLDSTASYFTPNYSALSNYTVNNNVLYTDGYYYRAAKPSGPATVYGAIIPGTNQLFWQPFYFATSDRPNIIKDGIPITQIPVWNATAVYSTGNQIQYLGIVYRATLDNTNQQPSGFYYSNTHWACLSPSQKTIVSSGFWNRASNNINSATASAFIYYYDKHGGLINNTAIDYSGYNAGIEGVSARFVLDYTDLNGTTESSLANAQTDGTIVNGVWAVTPATANLWRTSYGMASVNQTLAGTTAYIYSLIDAAVPDGRICVTFATDYTDTAHKTHGIVFAWMDTTDFYYVTRTSLRQVVSGVDTVLASWTRLSNGDRIVVDARLDINVYKYARTGDGKLTRIAHSAGTGPGTSGGVGQVGLIQKYSASGAL